MLRSPWPTITSMPRKVNMALDEESGTSFDRTDQATLQAGVVQIPPNRLRKALNTSFADLSEVITKLFDQSLVGVAVIDYNGVLVSMNSAYSGICGYLEIELLGQSFTKLFAPYDRARALESHQAFLDDGRVLSDEWVVVTATGASKYVSSQSVVTLSEAGDRQRLVYATDITEQKRLVRCSRQFDAIVQSSRDAIISVSLDRVVNSWNPGAEAMLGFSATEMVGCTMKSLTPADCIAMESLMFEGFCESELSRQYESKRLRKCGGMIDVSVTLYPIRNPAGRIIEASIVMRDITTSKAMKAELDLTSLILETCSEAILVSDENNLIIAINPAFTHVTGYTIEDVQGKNPSIFNSGLHEKSYFQEMWRALHQAGHWKGEIWDRRKDGEIHAKQLNIHLVRNERGDIHRHVAMFIDMTESKKSEETIWRQANFDSLTDLPNRQMLWDRLKQEVVKLDRTNMQLAVLLIDLDGFKEVNDTLGHDVGDRLLKVASVRIKECLRSTDTVARLGDDEFVVVLTELTESNFAEDVAQKLLLRLAEAFTLESLKIYITASIGITISPRDSSDAETLIKYADQAMYLSRKKGRNRFSYFNESLQTAAQKRLTLASELRDALSANQFQVYYQPIIELSTGDIHKAEALIRWMHPVRGMISPADFIPLAEETGLIMDIGFWVFQQAVRELDHWKKMFNPHFEISVNRSPVEFLATPSGKHHAFLRYLTENKQSVQGIIFEITEGLLLDSQDEVMDMILKIRDAGIEVALDDFGTGYSSLSYLRRFDIDYLKIDKSFVDNIATNADSLAVCEAIIVMAHKLGMKVIAEGVETNEQLNVLTDAGCDFGQGYLFSRPIPAVDFENFLMLRGPLHQAKNGVAEIV